MKAIETKSNQAPANRKISMSQPHFKFRKVLDGRKSPIRGLWERNGRFYARLSVEDDDGVTRTRWVPLEGAETAPQAQEKQKALQVDRERGALPVLKQTPKLADYALKRYFPHFEVVTDAKRPATLAKERGALKGWIDHCGGVRLDKLKKVHVTGFIAKRQAGGISGRTVNLDVIALRNVLNMAIDDGWLKVLPTENLRPLKWTPRTRGLVTEAQINALCKAGMKVSKNGQQFSDYIRLMAYCGSRRNETLRLKWDDVEWQQRQLSIGADGLAKNHETRRVDFNAKLEAHLKRMLKRRDPEVSWLFPSPQRGDKDASTKTFMESLRLARKKAGMPGFGFHDCRHFFISYCVMSGIDYMTVARWVGHKDGGVLIGRVYGHLSNEHAQAQAARLSFGPSIVPLPKGAIA
jgi:integrase